MASAAFDTVANIRSVRSRHPERRTIATDPVSFDSAAALRERRAPPIPFLGGWMNKAGTSFARARRIDSGAPTLRAPTGHGQRGAVPFPPLVDRSVFA